MIRVRIDEHVRSETSAGWWLSVGVGVWVGVGVVGMSRGLTGHGPRSSLRCHMGTWIRGKGRALPKYLCMCLRLGFFVFACVWW